MSVQECCICLVDIHLPKGKKIGDYTKSIIEFEGEFALSGTLEPIVTKCGHLFHHSCLKNWLETFKSTVSPASCPYCRQELMPKKLVQKYALFHAFTFNDENELSMLIMMIAWIAYCHL